MILPRISCKCHLRVFSLWNQKNQNRRGGIREKGGEHIKSHKIFNTEISFCIYPSWFHLHRQRRHFTLFLPLFLRNSQVTCNELYGYGFGIFPLSLSFVLAWRCARFCKAPMWIAIVCAKRMCRKSAESRLRKQENKMKNPSQGGSYRLVNVDEIFNTWIYAS